MHRLMFVLQAEKREIVIAKSNNFAFYIDFVLGEALVTLCFVEPPSAMHEHAYKRHAKSVAGVFTWMQLLPPTSPA